MPETSGDSSAVEQGTPPKAYVVGFVVDPRRREVVLIRKNRPEWQCGLLNGVGGKVEMGEPPLDAIVREFEEETGARIAAHEWDHLCSIRWREDNRTSGEAAAVHFFRHLWRSELPLVDIVSSQTDEHVHIVPLSWVANYPVIPNLRWLVPLAAYTADTYQPFDVWATVAEVLHGAADSGSDRGAS